MFMQVAASLLALELGAAQVMQEEARAPALPAQAEAAPMAPAPAALEIAPDWAMQDAAKKKIIERAIRETLKEDREAAAAKAEADSKAAAIPQPYRASSHPDMDAQQRFETLFAEAKVPGCLSSEGLKRQPTFFLVGILALPFVAVAKIRGKCN